MQASVPQKAPPVHLPDTSFDRPLPFLKPACLSPSAVPLASPSPRSLPSTPQTISTRRTLPYAPSRAYLPDLETSTRTPPSPSLLARHLVTHWTRPDVTGRRWPARVDPDSRLGPFHGELHKPCTLCSWIRGGSRERQGPVSIAADVPAQHGRDRSIYIVLGARPVVSSRASLQGGRWQPDDAGNAAHDSSVESTDVTLSVRFRFANPAPEFCGG